MSLYHYGRPASGEYVRSWRKARGSRRTAQRPMTSCLQPFALSALTFAAAARKIWVWPTQNSLLRIAGKDGEPLFGPETRTANGTAHGQQSSQQIAPPHRTAQVTHRDRVGQPRAGGNRPQRHRL